MKGIDLIGLGGLPRSGKDSFADFLFEDFGWIKIGMSDLLDNALMMLDPFLYSEEKLVRYTELRAATSYTEAKENPEVRRLLRVLGTDVGRALDPNLWVRPVNDRVAAAIESGQRVVVTGIRFPEEIDMIRRHGGISIFLDRPQSGKSEHVSDAGLSPQEFLFRIHNYGSLKMLRDEAAYINEISYSVGRI